MNKRTWLWVAIGVATVLMVGCVALVGTGFYFVSRQMEVASADADQAESEFEGIRDRFSGQEPLITIGADGRPVLDAFEKRAAEYSGPPPDTLRVLAFNGRDGRLVRFSLPFWLLRLSPSGRFGFRANQFDFERIHLDAADFERVGPALLLDHTERGARVMLWSE